MKRLLSILIGSLACVWLSAQPSRMIMDQEEGRITFAVDDVDLTNRHCGWKMDGSELAVEIHRNFDWNFEIVVKTWSTNSRYTFAYSTFLWSTILWNKRNVLYL